MTILAFGFFLGFIGYLPPGNINLTVVQLALTDTKSRLWSFIFFATLMEFIYCLGCLTGLDLLMKQPQLVTGLQWSSVFLFAILGLLSFFHNQHDNEKAAFSGFRRGIFTALFNPLQVPFWLVWGVYLSDKLSTGIVVVTLFSIITSAGTVCILWLYAVGGKKLVEVMKLEQKLLERIIGLLFIGLALLQLFKLLHHK